MAKLIFLLFALLIDGSTGVVRIMNNRKDSGVVFTNRGSSFSLPVVVGSQKIKLNLGIEGFFGDSVVYGPGTACEESDNQCIQHDTFDQTKSTSFKTLNNERNFTFILGTAPGIFGTDDLSLGTLQLKNTPFGVLSNITRHLNQKTNNSGHISMWAPAQQENLKGTMQRLVELKAKRIVIFHAPSSSEQNGEHTITFGAEDTTHCMKNWASFKNQKSLFKNQKVQARPWTIQWSDFKWGDYSKKEAVNVAMNVGADYFAAPRRHATHIFERLNAKYNTEHFGGQVDCSKLKNAPVLEFSAKGRTFSVTPSQYIKQIDNSTCILNIYPDELDQWTMPYMFHQGYCVKYDYLAKTVNIADRK